MNLISVDQFRREAREERAPTGAVFRVTAKAPDEVAGKERTFRFCFSDGSIDRMGDTIDPNGWDTADFLANPVALWAHDSSQPPIGTASNVAIEGARLMGDITFATPEDYAFADTIFRLVRGKFLRAVSVGFMPTEYSFVDNDPDRGYGIDFKRQQLLEISVCPIPANPNALSEARAKGIDTGPVAEWVEKLLESGGQLIIPKSELERLRKAAKEPSMTRRTTTRRADGDDDDDDKPKSCGKSDDEECGMSDKSKCSVHGKRKADDDDEEKMLRVLRRLIGSIGKADDDDDKKPDDDSDLPMEHHDAIRIAHKCLKTAKAFHAEAIRHYGKAMDLLAGVAESLDDDDGDKKPDDEDKSDDDDDDRDDKPEDKAAQLRRAAELRRKLAA